MRTPKELQVRFYVLNNGTNDANSRQGTMYLCENYSALIVLVQILPMGLLTGGRHLFHRQRKYPD
jgi:hypothetical protein